MIHEILGISQNEYELRQLDQWFKWCSFKASTRIECQKLMVCQPLFNWWQKQYSKFEQDFLEEIRPYQHQVSPEDAERLLSYHLLKIHNYYSKPLILKALK
ncbi:hypothetical protein [Aquimarina algiphila]|uniref:hypothetical protein n=1 Tax=Aquimarina algiphila TaxID=2047982 RepID=UPI00232FAE5A|nr:hypothetical protein [Aquimarina algiphila]